jgi:2-polyprenyl-6-hydroxyphenyl methylase/3-demethylubiquinone-9 3-methyltransferase
VSLPDRYPRWREAVDLAISSSLRPGMAILDVGSGRLPTIPTEARPPDCRYVGLDLSAAELAKAPPGSYDESVVSDVAEFRSELVDRFDLSTSLFVFEHVRPLTTAFENINAYLKPGGSFVAYFSGTYALFAIANRILPTSIATAILEKVMRRPAGTTFPAHYDRCWDTALREALRGWDDVRIVPLYLGATYFNFAPPLRSAYLLYEEWALRGGHRDLATHYVVHARKAPLHSRA